MRILVMLNPTNRYGTKGAYTELRKFLLCDGYIKLQNEVFMRVEDTKKGCVKHQNSIKSYLPRLRFVSRKVRLARKTCRRKRLGNAIKM